MLRVCTSHLFNSVWDLRASKDLDYAGQAVRSHFMFFWMFKTSPRLLQVVQENSALLLLRSFRFGTESGRVVNVWIFCVGRTNPLNN